MIGKSTRHEVSTSEDQSNSINRKIHKCMLQWFACKIHTRLQKKASNAFRNNIQKEMMKTKSEME